jgi:endonuclease/exonuclease/phosphatase family metal-dependent hydrolase
VQHAIACWNIEWMNRMFTNGVVTDDNVGRAEAIASVIRRIDADLIAISEGANEPAEHQDFIDRFLGGAYTSVMGRSRGAQNLVYYLRAPFTAVSVDDAFDVYGDWIVDVDEDGLAERHRFERRPLDLVAEVSGHRIRFISVHTKSKGVYSIADLPRFELLSGANRAKLVAQGRRLRARLDNLIAAGEHVIVLGDMNDGPGLDFYERSLGTSFVESVVGSVFEPEGIFHDPLWWMTKSAADRRKLWTAAFDDPIVNNPLGWKHRVWLDHILASPSLLDPAAPVRLVKDSGSIDTKDTTSYRASDHFAVTAVLEAD